VVTSKKFITKIQVYPSRIFTESNPDENFVSAI